MTRATVILIAVSLFVGAVAAVPLGFYFGPAHWAAAAVGFGLAASAAAATLAVTLCLSRHSRYGLLLGLALGPIVRAVFVLGIAGGLFIASREWPEELNWGHPLVFWLWVLFGYLVTLVTETALLARPVKG